MVPGKCRLVEEAEAIASGKEGMTDGKLIPTLWATHVGRQVGTSSLHAAADGIEIRPPPVDGV